MRSNIVASVLGALLLVLVCALGFRARAPHTVVLPASASARASAPAPSSAVPSPAGSSSAGSGELVSSNPKPSLGRTLRVTGIGWEPLAPALLANDGLESKKDSEFGK